MMYMKKCFFPLFAFLFFGHLQAQKIPFNQVGQSHVGLGWAGNSINTVAFRKNAIVSAKGYQFIAYYNLDGYVVIGKRKSNQSHWELDTTTYQGHVADAHNSISIAIDGDGFLHMAFDHHGNNLHYCKSIKPLSTQFTELMPMVGSLESKVTYPEFYTLANGDILFLYRDGSSGNGNLVLNKYNTKTKVWARLQNNLIDGEGKRNAYWQAATDKDGDIHISWVWRESPDVASNHDMSYAVSRDGGEHWEKSNGEKYSLPIRISNAEKIASIAPASELMNQTSMCVNDVGMPIIASYWKGINNVPQYQIVFYDGRKWQIKDFGIRKSNFTLSGAGTKSIPISRPQVISWGNGKKAFAGIIFRDKERGNGVSFAYAPLKARAPIQVMDWLKKDMGAWEPTFDNDLWKREKKIHVFLQNVEQVDGEGLRRVPPQMVSVLETICKE